VRLNASADFEAKASYAIDVIGTDGGGLTSTKAVTIGVTDVAENVAPVATGESIVISDNITLIPKQWLLGNDSDADGGALSLSGLPSGMSLDGSGNVVVAPGSLPAAGAVTYAATPTQAAYTVYSLSYTVSDGYGGVSAPATLKLAVVDTGGGVDKVDLNEIATHIGGSYSYSSISGQGNGDTLIGMTTVGSSAIDLLVGDGGNDVLNGGTGSDTLTGSGGSDTFVFSSALGATNIDIVTDFNSGSDHVSLLKAGVFANLAGSSGGTLGLDFNTTGQTGGHIVYDAGSGNLYYDANGGSHTLSGLGADSIVFATLTNTNGTHPTIVATDFIIG
jgi:Ca2+-binding RTX toxin-like protein